MNSFFKLLLLLCNFIFISNVLADLSAPEMKLSTNDKTVLISWETVPDATGYKLFYAPYPEQTPIESLDVGDNKQFSVELWNGAAFYVAIKAYSNTEESNYSNVDYFVIQDDLSFYPIFLKSKSRAGDLQANNWVYRINNDIPLELDNQGISLTMTFGDLHIELDPSSSLKKANFDGQFSGATSGDFYAAVEQDLQFINGKTLIENQKLAMGLGMDILGASVNIDMNLNLAFNSHAEWFLDRSDLDLLPIGYIYDEQGQVDGSLTGSVGVSSAFFSKDIDVNESIVSAEKWEIIDKQDSMNIQGREYFNIVVVKRTTLLPSMGVSGDVSNENIDMTYWVAKGIGMIKGVGQFDFNGQALMIELVDSNLL